MSMARTTRPLSLISELVALRSTFMGVSLEAALPPLAGRPSSRSKAMTRPRTKKTAL